MLELLERAVPRSLGVHGIKRWASCGRHEDPFQIWAKAFEAGDFRASGSKLVRRAYLPSLKLEQNGAKSKPRWRSKFFVETLYGHWTSEECFDAAQGGRLQHRFQHAKAEAREKDLSLLQERGDSNVNSWTNDILDELRRIAKRLDRLSDEEVEDYLHVKNRQINEEHYRKLAVKQIRRDQGKAKHRSFRERYESGYSFTRVPAMGVEYDQFVESLCDSIAAAMAIRKTPTNRLARRIKAKLQEQRVPHMRWRDGEGLYKIIAECWKSWGDSVRVFHDNDLEKSAPG